MRAKASEQPCTEANGLKKIKWICDSLFFFLAGSKWCTAILRGLRRRVETSFIEFGATSIVLFVRLRSPQVAAPQHNPLKRKSPCWATRIYLGVVFYCFVIFPTRRLVVNLDCKGGKSGVRKTTKLMRVFDVFWWC